MNFALYKTVLLSFLLLISCVQAQTEPDAVLTSDNPADYASGKLLANHLGIGLVVTSWGSLSNDSIRELLKLNSSRIYVIGGSTAIPNAGVDLEMEGIMVEKLFNGTNRYETSALVALEWRNVSKIILAYGYDEEGIEEARERAELENDTPILFITPDSIPPPVDSAIRNLSPKRAQLYPSPDMNQSYHFNEISKRGMEIEVIPQNHETKTFNIISLADSTIDNSESTNFNFQPRETERITVEKLVEESRGNIVAAKEQYSNGLYNKAFRNAVLAKFKAKNSIRIKKGIIKLPLDLEDMATLKISQIIFNPLQYLEKKVQITGKVEEAIDVGGTAYVKVFDGTERIIITFPADRDHMLSKGFIFMADPEVLGKTVRVDGTLKPNKPLTDEEHGAFEYLIEADKIILDM